MTRTQIEKKFGVKIREDCNYLASGGRGICSTYRIYSADGCLWENGLRTIKAVEKECREWEPQLLAIKARTANN